tara:strand:- start:979 stop:1503 length:525 start_codon:yes stop_codon:yes gene_type:complete
MTDLITMLANLSHFLAPVEKLITASGYLLGMIFMFIAIMKLKKIGDFRARGSSSEKIFGPIAYFVGGSALIYLPSAFTVMGNTVFGSGNILAYTQFNAIDIVGVMKTIIQVVGVIWFIRGCVLMIQASDPSVKHGPKGFAFLCAGVMTVNFDATISFLNYTLSGLMNITKSIGA